ncbi:hypothetical protein [Ornithinimicrobium avium]|uniref:Uncharacterized protein n=1 Tax=Ornithinimicrobium avium TaxID=2283195 RepID=A0A345NLR4_9MICO|nr:hypothetical protein [Ornithinimicrobium avium]AXH95972.1 hypothetical protein DV701_07400 [Ornithinimicrobium avium]
MNTNEKKSNDQESNDHSFLFQVAVHVVGSWLSPGGLPLDSETVIGAIIIAQLWRLTTRVASLPQPPPGPHDDPDVPEDGSGHG